MNKQQRKSLEKAVELMQEAFEIIETIGEEEQEKFDNANEGLQSTGRYETIQDNAEKLSDQATELNEVIDEITEILNA
jgi:hypothetical protein